MSVDFHKLSKRIADVRDLTHLSQIALAKRLGVSSSLVSHWEAGTRVPSQPQLTSLAQGLGVSLDYLLNAEVLPRFMYRAKATLPAEQKRQVDRVLTDASQQVYFVDVACRTAGKNLKPLGLKADFNAEQLGDVADQIREALRLNRRVTLEELKEALTEWGVFVFEWNMPVEVSGLSYRGATTVIIINKLHGKQRKLFTLAHELGHVLFHLGHDQETVVSFIASNRDPLEKQANQFASELLMASVEIDRLLRECGTEGVRQPVMLGMAAKMFNVSVDAMFYRLAARGIFRWEEKARYIPKPVEYKTPPEHRVEELEEQVSGKFLRTIISLHENQKASAGKLAEWVFAPRTKVEEYLTDLSREQENGIGGGEDE